MAFVPPTWFDGMLFYIGCSIIPLIIFALMFIIGFIKLDDGDIWTYVCIFGVVLLVVGTFAGYFITEYAWNQAYEVPSVDEKVITVKEWQPRVGLQSDNGMMHIDSADDLMLITSDDECYYNTENFWFSKFDTRDLFNKLKVNGTYKIKYYGWREPFNSGFPNVLSVEEVVDESNVSDVKFSDYFGTKLIGGVN